MIQNGPETQILISFRTGRPIPGPKMVGDTLFDQKSSIWCPNAKTRFRIWSGSATVSVYSELFWMFWGRIYASQITEKLFPCLWQSETADFDEKQSSRAHILGHDNRDKFLDSRVMPTAFLPGIKLVSSSPKMKYNLQELNILGLVRFATPDQNFNVFFQLFHFFVSRSSVTSRNLIILLPGIDLGYAETPYERI